MTSLHFEWAGWYASEGIRYFPLWGVMNGSCRCKLGSACKAPGKHSKLDKWKRPDSVMPGPLDNMGVSTDTLVVIDFDIEDPDLTEFPETFMVRTGKGLHLWYRKPDTAKEFKSFANWRPKVDIRASGGMVVAPPSRTARGGFYEPGNDQPIRTLPRWLADELPERTTIHRPDAPPLVSIPTTTPNIMEPIGRQLVHRVASCTELRNQNLFRVACDFFRDAAYGYVGSDVLEQIREAAILSGLDHGEVERTIQSAQLTVASS